MMILQSRETFPSNVNTGSGDMNTSASSTDT